MYRSCQLTIFHNVNLLLPEMLYCISGIVGLQLNILLMCIKSVGRIAYYHRGHIALKHGSDWNIPMSEFHLAHFFKTARCLTLFFSHRSITRHIHHFSFPMTSKMICELGSTNICIYTSAVIEDIVRDLDTWRD